MWSVSFSSLPMPPRPALWGGSTQGPPPAGLCKPRVCTALCPLQYHSPSLTLGHGGGLPSSQVLLTRRQREGKGHPGWVRPHWAWVQSNPLFLGSPAVLLPAGPMHCPTAQPGRAPGRLALFFPNNPALFFAMSPPTGSWPTSGHLPSSGVPRRLPCTQV